MAILGSTATLAGGISEPKIDVGPGYRVDYTQRGNRLLLLLAGGDKSSQADDIELAIQLARNFQEWISISGVLPAALATLDKESLDRLDEDLAKLLVILNGDERAARIPLAQL